MKKLNLTLATLALSITATFSAFAGEWKQEDINWKYLNDDGTYTTNTWQWIDGNADGMAEKYYFNENSILLVNTTTPDGSVVDANGAWIVDGVIQYQAVTSVQPAAPATTPASLQTTAQSTNSAASQAAAQPAKASSTKNTASSTTNESSSTVWLSATGEKYHKINNCGKMNPSKARQISLSDAQARGYQPCSKCY